MLENKITEYQVFTEQIFHFFGAQSQQHGVICSPPLFLCMAISEVQKQSAES